MEGGHFNKKVEAIADFLPLLGGEHLGGVDQRGRDPLAGLVGEGDLAGPEGFDRGGVDGRAG